MKEKQYPVGLPVYHVLINNLSFIKKVEGVDGDSLILGGQKIKQKHVIPLTEAEYFTEVMQPNGWVKNESNGFMFGYRKPYIKDELTADQWATIQENRCFLNFMFDITRELIALQSEALDHYEALQAIRNFENQSQ